MIPAIAEVLCLQPAIEKLSQHLSKPNPSLPGKYPIPKHTRRQHPNPSRGQHPLRRVANIPSVAWPTSQPVVPATPSFPPPRRSRHPVTPPSHPPLLRHPRESGDPGPRLHNPPTHHCQENTPLPPRSASNRAPPSHPPPLRHPRESGDPDPRLHNPPTHHCQENTPLPPRSASNRAPPSHPSPLRHPRETGDPDPRIHSPPTRHCQ